jgi:hypothetical protein
VIETPETGGGAVRQVDRLARGRDRQQAADVHGRDGDRHHRPGVLGKDRR